MNKLIGDVGERAPPYRSWGLFWTAICIPSAQSGNPNLIRCREHSPSRNSLEKGGYPKSGTSLAMGSFHSRKDNNGRERALWTGIEQSIRQHSHSERWNALKPVPLDLLKTMDIVRACLRFSKRQALVEGGIGSALTWTYVFISVNGCLKKNAGPRVQIFISERDDFLCSGMGALWTRLLG